MGLTPNVVSDTPIAVTWGNEIRDRTVQVFATTTEHATQWPTPSVGAVSVLSSAPGFVHVWNGTSWVQITAVAASMLGVSTRTATTYGDLADAAGPAATILTGTKAMVTISGNVNNSGGTALAYMSYGVTGASTVAPNDNEALAVAGAAGSQVQASYTSYVTGLTPGLNTFTAKYRAVSGTITALTRKIIVIGVP